MSARGQEPSEISPDELAATQTAGYKAAAQRDVNELAQLDANDESLNAWKKNLGIVPGAGPGGAKPIVKVLALRLTSPELQKPIVLDVSTPEKIAALKSAANPPNIKEGSQYAVEIDFTVSGGICAGLKYIQVAKRMGMSDKLEQMIGSYGPSEQVVTKRFPPDDAPSGMLARGNYTVRSRVTDDDGAIHADFIWTFKIAKDWFAFGVTRQPEGVSQNPPFASRGATWGLHIWSRHLSRPKQPRALVMGTLTYDYVQKFCIVGNSSVGKSSILVRLTDKRFLGAGSEPTIGVEFGSRLITLEDGRKIKLQIWDTAGQESFRAVTRSYYRNAEGCLLVFDVLDRRSFTDLRSWYDDIQQWADEQVVVILVGNKVDSSASREVTSEEAQAWASEHHLEYIETSAKTGQNIEEAFEQTARKVHERLLANREAMEKKRKTGIQLASGNRVTGCCI